MTWYGLPTTYRHRHRFPASREYESRSSPIRRTLYPVALVQAATHRPSVWSPRAAAVAAGVVPPGSRIVYADNDLMVLIHANALLTSVREDRDQLG